MGAVSFKFKALRYHEKPFRRQVDEAIEIKMSTQSKRTTLNNKLEFNRSVLTNICYEEPTEEEKKTERELIHRMKSLKEKWCEINNKGRRHLTLEERRELGRKRGMPNLTVEQLEEIKVKELTRHQLREILKNQLMPVEREEFYENNELEELYEKIESEERERLAKQNEEGPIPASVPASVPVPETGRSAAADKLEDGGGAARGGVGALGEVPTQQVKSPYVTSINSVIPPTETAVCITQVHTTPERPPEKRRRVMEPGRGEAGGGGVEAGGQGQCCQEFRGPQS